MNPDLVYAGPASPPKVEVLLNGSSVETESFKAG